MKRTEAFFLVIVIAAAGLFAAASIGHARDILGSASAAQFRPTSAGIVRDVDLDRIKRLIDQRHLSPHEADYYREAPTSLPPPPKPAQ